MAVQTIPIKTIAMQVNEAIQLDTSQLSQNIIQDIKRDLTLPNPAYQQAKKYNRDTSGLPKTIQLYSQFGTVLTLPRGYGSSLISRLSFYNFKISVDDHRITLPSAGFEAANVKLREYQNQAVTRLVHMRQGGVVAPCGAGKTIILLTAMSVINQPALWITHTQELANQTMERAYQVLNLEPGEIGLVGGGKKTIGKRFTVGLVQTLKKMDLSKIANRFGCIIVDEAHHLAASSFFDTVSQFPALYRLWASATIERADGLTSMIFAAGGPILHTIDRSQVPTITPKLVVVETEFRECFDPYNDLMTRLCNDSARNDLIVDTVLSDVDGNYSLVLSERVEHLQKLAHMMKRKRQNLRVELLTGSLPKKVRDDVMRRVQDKQVDVLLATQLAREGLDITHLNRLFLAMPKRSAAAIEQEVGRVMRQSEGKKDAIVYDFADLKSGVLEAQFRVRAKVYKKLGMEVTDGDQPNQPIRNVQ